MEREKKEMIEKKNTVYPPDHDFEKCNGIECDCDCKYCQNVHWE